MAEGIFSDQLSTKGRASILPKFNSDADYLVERGGSPSEGERYLNLARACVRIFINGKFINEGDRVGTIKASVNPNPDDGYLLLDGSTIGNVGSGADIEGVHLQELFDLIKIQSGNNPTDVFTNGDVTTLPDYRGRNLTGLDTGDADFDEMGKTAGAKTQAGTHSHVAGTINPGGGHNHGAGTYAVTIAADGGHNHGGFTSFVTNRVITPRIIDASNNIGDDHNHEITAEPDHDHGGTTPVTGNSTTDGTHSHTQAPTANADVNVSTLSPYGVVQYQIKV